MSANPNDPVVPAPDEHLPPESTTSPETSSLSESPNNLPPETTPLPETPQKESSPATVVILFLVGLFLLLSFAGNGSNSPNLNYKNPYESPYSAPEWFGKPKLPPDTLSKLRIQELQEAEIETANWLDNQQAKSPGEIYRMNISAVVFVAVKNSATLIEKNDSEANLMGSGVIISSSKYGVCILTAAHLLESEHYKRQKDAQLVVYFKGMTNPQSVKLAERSKNYDAMILQFTDQHFKPGQTAILGKSSLLNAGAELYSIGNGAAGAFLLTKGIVSIKSHNFRLPEDPNPYPDPRRKKVDYRWPTAILADITIASGFSGGPLFNKLGQLIGLNVGVIPDLAGNISVGLPIDDLQKDFNNIF